MLVVDLSCAQGHRFEGWFASSDDLAAQQAKGLVTCPVCGDAHVTRVPSASHVVVQGGGERRSADQAPRQVGESAPKNPPVPASSPDASSQAPDPEVVRQLQAMWLNTVREIVQNTEDVGDSFPEEVRAMHHGDAPERAVRGQASPEERQALRDEGIEVIALPMPEGIKGPLH
ncbi:MAG: hypothetical protein RJB60_2487 [Pseudomonadota bacterium]|jgi:hypothetical protein